VDSDIRTARVQRAVASHAPSLLAYFVRRVDPAEDAADLLGETLLIIWKRASSMPSDDAEMRPWMFGVARNVLLHHYRRNTRQSAVTDRLRSMLSVTPHPGFADPTEYADLHAAVRKLDVVDRDIIGLVHWDGFTLVETSRILRMKEPTVRSRYHRARATLRELLHDDHGAASPAPTSTGADSSRRPRVS
jgi:RNA polymerase sigma-70 factor (ECF subfamily)